LAGAVADCDAPSVDPGSLRKAAAKGGFGGVGVAVQRPQLGLDRLEDLGVWREGGLVGGELDEVAVEGVCGRGRVDRDRADAVVELEARHWAPFRSRRSDSASRRYTCLGSVSGSA